MAETPSPRIEAKGAAAAALVARLETLRDRHRLLLHMWEETDLGDHPDFSMHLLTQIPPEEWDARLGQAPHLSIDAARHRADSLAGISASLIPSAASRLSLVPFECHPGNRFAGGFLFDASADHPTPPRILRAMPYNMVSNHTQANRKSLCIATRTGIAALDADRQADMNEQDYLRSMRGEAGIQHGQRMLDALGAHYETHDPDRPKAAMRDSEGNVVSPGMPLQESRCRDAVDNGEVIALLDYSHAVATVIPSFNLRGGQQYERSATRLGAALIGLRRHDHGIDLPVVLYHVNTEPKNGFEYIGGSAGELHAVATAELRHLASTGQLQQFEDSEQFHFMLMEDLCRSELGIDLRNLPTLLTESPKIHATPAARR